MGAVISYYENVDDSTQALFLSSLCYVPATAVAWLAMLARHRTEVDRRGSSRPWLRVAQLVVLSFILRGLWFLLSTFGWAGGSDCNAGLQCIAPIMLTAVNRVGQLSFFVASAMASQQLLRATRPPSAPVPLQLQWEDVAAAAARRGCCGRRPRQSTGSGSGSKKTKASDVGGLEVGAQGPAPPARDRLVTAGDIIFLLIASWFIFAQILLLIAQLFIRMSASLVAALYNWYIVMVGILFAILGISFAVNGFALIHTLARQKAELRAWIGVAEAQLHAAKAAGGGRGAGASSSSSSSGGGAAGGAGAAGPSPPPQLYGLVLPDGELRDGEEEASGDEEEGGDDEDQGTSEDATQLLRRRPASRFIKLPPPLPSPALAALGGLLPAAHSSASAGAAAGSGVGAASASAAGAFLPFDAIETPPPSRSGSRDSTATAAAAAAGAGDGPLSRPPAPAARGGSAEPLETPPQHLIHLQQLQATLKLLRRARLALPALCLVCSFVFFLRAFMFAARTVFGVMFTGFWGKLLYPWAFYTVPDIVGGLLLLWLCTPLTVACRSWRCCGPQLARVSITDAQRAGLNDRTWVGVVALLRTQWDDPASDAVAAASGSAGAAASGSARSWGWWSGGRSRTDPPGSTAASSALVTVVREYLGFQTRAAARAERKSCGRGGRTPLPLTPASLAAVFDSRLEAQPPRSLPNAPVPRAAAIECGWLDEEVAASF